MFPPKYEEVNKLCDEWDCDEDKKPKECTVDDTSNLPGYIDPNVCTFLRHHKNDKVGDADDSIILLCPFDKA